MPSVKNEGMRNVRLSALSSQSEHGNYANVGRVAPERAEQPR